MDGRKLNSTLRALILFALGSAFTSLGTWSRSPAALASHQADHNHVTSPQGPPVASPNQRALNPNTRHVTYASVNGKGGEEVSGPYEVVKDWPKPVVEGSTINAEAIYVESPDRIIGVGRGIRKNPWTSFWGPAVFRALGASAAPELQARQYMVVVYDRNGKLIETWDHLIPILPDVQLVGANPYDPERHIWIATGRGLVQLTRDGKQHVNTLDAEDVPHPDPQHPRFVVEHFAWAKNGDLYAAGGHQVTKFSKDGHFISAFGKPGSRPGEFGIVGEGLLGSGLHGIVVDSNRNRLYVADRVNSRIQVFDLKGKYLDHWPNIVAPYCIRLTADGRYLWVSDGYTQKLMKFNALTGKLIPGSTWGTMGIAPGALWGIHFFTTDSEGNLYVGEDMAWRIQKFMPRKGGNPTQLIGPLM